MNFGRLFRIISRLFQFLGVVFGAMADYWIRLAFRTKKSGLLARELWLQRHSRRMLKMFQLKPQVSGAIPTRGLLISNHLSYLDIVVISSVTPAVFVAKKEVRSWPALGLCAQMGGTLFVDRQRRMQVGEMNDEIQKALDAGALVVLFPEGTSSNGQGVLPFRSALLEPAAQHVHSLHVGCLQYSLDEGDAGNEVCYWGDHSFFSHMLNLMGHRTLRASVRFAPFDSDVTDRKELARQLREEVLKLKGEVIV
ncbi:MAG TPA: lysophospholipid acyltransferase family protein [Verrucomicrobiae bacterium]|jgi:1-acyl-sn-glycerol-3-phosphate acyltransferase